MLSRVIAPVKLRRPPSRQSPDHATLSTGHRSHKRLPDSTKNFGIIIKVSFSGDAVKHLALVASLCLLAACQSTGPSPSSTSSSTTTQSSRSDDQCGAQSRQKLVG